MPTIKGIWTLMLKDSLLQRSSQTLSTIGTRAFIFGGELQPRQPRDNNIYILNTSPPNPAHRYKASLQDYGDESHDPVDSASDMPVARVGTASAVAEGKPFYFSGRGGTAMSPIDEKGAIWSFNFSDRDGVGWNLISPSDPNAPYPEARSYHCMTSNLTSTLYVHAGCPSSGRLSDLWSFDLENRRWMQLASAPGAPRGGTSIAFLNDKIYRMGGFDGKNELGGAIDVYDVKTDTWSTIAFAADGIEGPGARSVAALLALEVEGEELLVTLFGESDPSALGHAGAGNMLEDAWVWNVASQAWKKVVAEGEKPKPRGWFAADVVTYEGRPAVIVQGGLDETNQRLDDAWVLGF